MTVGTKSEQKTWYLPKKVLTHCSPFFDSALNGNFVEARSQAVNLPEDDPIAFEIWATWLSLGNCDGSFQCTDYAQTYVRAWILGDKFACPAFKDHVMSRLLDWLDSDGWFCCDTPELVYQVSSPGSKLRWLFVDCFAWDKLHGNLAKNTDEIIMFLRDIHEFSEDVVRREVEAGMNATLSPSVKKHLY